MTLVPHTGQLPCAARRPFLRVTSLPSNSRLARHFTQYASYLATPGLLLAMIWADRSRLACEAARIGGLAGTMLPLPRHGCKYLPGMVRVAAADPSRIPFGVPTGLEGAKTT
jgi:hypothetical protein